MNYNIESYTGPYIQKTNNHLYIAPSPSLKSIVAHYTITFSNKQNTIPEGSVLNLIPDVSGCFVFKFFDQLSIKVWGPTTKVVTVPNDLNTFPCRFFVEFLPGGLYRILGQSVGQLLDLKKELVEINALLYQEIEQEISHFQTFDEIVPFIDQILCREMKKHSIHKEIYQWIEKVHLSSEDISMQQIAQNLHMSERQINRYFHKYIGMSMKKFSKIINVNRLIQEISDKKLLDLAYDYEYFDQAHFNHVFKEICETTPSHYLENMSDFYNELYKF
jgi:AraC-like DNA-binding protein